MAIRRKHLPGVWRRMDSDGVTQTLKLAEDGGFRLECEGGPAYLRALWPVVGNLTGKWILRESDKLITRIDWKEVPFFKLPGLKHMSKFTLWLEDVLGIDWGNRDSDEIWTIISLEENELELDRPPVFKRVKWE